MDDTVELICENETFQASRRILCENSEYFNVMFTRDFIERDMACVKLEVVSRESLKHILQYLSGTDKTFQLNNIPMPELLKLLEDSAMLQFQQLEAGCEVEVLKSINYENALLVFETCGKLDKVDLAHKARALTLWYFSFISQTTYFYKLNIHQVESYLSDPELNSPSEEEGVWEAVENWLHSNTSTYNSTHQSENLHRLVKCLKADKLDTSVVQAMCLSPIVQQDDKMKQVIKLLRTRLLKNGLTLEMQKDRSSCECDVSTDEPNNPEIAECETQQDGEALSYLEGWLSASLDTPRGLPLVPCVVANVVTSPGRTSPCLVRLNESGHALETVLRLEKVETSLGSLVGFKVVANGCKMYVMGGETMTRVSSWNHAIWEFDLIMRKWMFITNLPSVCRHMFACFLDDDLYVMGGFGKHRFIQDSVKKYSIASGTWTNCPPLPKPMYSASCCTYKSNIYVVESCVYQFSSQRGTWVQMDVILPPGHSFCSVLPGDRCIYLTTAFGTKVYAWDPSTRQSKFDLVCELELPCSQACLIGDHVYSMSQDQFCDEFYCEQTNMLTRQGRILWRGFGSSEVGGVADFDSTHHHGCVPLLIY